MLVLLSTALADPGTVVAGAAAPAFAVADGKGTATLLLNPGTGSAKGALDALSFAAGATVPLHRHDASDDADLGVVGPEAPLAAGLADEVTAAGIPCFGDPGRGPPGGEQGVRDAVRALVATVHQPVLDELARRGTPYRSGLFAGLMLTADSPRVLESDARFGDPECEPLMVRSDEDVLPWLLGAATGALPQGEPTFAAGAACCGVLASRGYPEAPERGVAIPEPPPAEDVLVFHAGTARGPDGVLRAHAGRVLGITGLGPDLATARRRAYEALPGWSFPGAGYRTDIAASG